MKTFWDLHQLDTLIRAQKYDCERTKQLLWFVDSLAREEPIFRYHARCARDAFKHIKRDDSLSVGTDWALLAFAGDDLQRSEIENSRVASEAHLIGAFHITRNALDIFAQLVNGLVLETPLPMHDCTFEKVKDRLDNVRLKESFESLASSHWFKYVQAFVNVSKHRYLVEHSLSTDFVEERSGIKIGAFEYRKQKFPAYWIEEALCGVAEVHNLIVPVGQELNRFCLSVKSSPETRRS